jgi:acetyl-CoA/propionyl-CoA carboxylase biotin carboxyl carrier protein
MHELSPVLIANRGEIAIRVARTVHALGLASVGVVTEADSDPAHPAAHADVSDMVVSIDSYLDASELLRAARLSGARSVHPGYGFLSENAAFARAVVEAGLVWIGPPPEAIELMGDKGAAKDAAAAAGVPVVPAGDDGGFPVVVKAVAGGGGKGMRVVRAAEELQDATAAAQREALAAFGDDRVIVERYLERPRHIEIQVLADAHGTCVHLGERECSLQRRHQKVVEEAPSPVVDGALRARMGEAAVTLARACGYVGVGTVEFIATGDASKFYFLEMNTRLQVEHPVTELVYGVDLVEQQLRVAAGEPLALEQATLVPEGHAVEARLYAEDPAAGFLPAVGTVRVYREPSGPGVRVDSGIRAGSVIGTSYDPMLAKVIAHGSDRATALARLDRALASYAIAGVTTNAAFSRALLARADVRAGEQDTGLLERVLAEPPAAPPEDLVAAAMVAAAGSARPAGPWRRALAEHGEVRVGDGRVSVGERSWAADGPRAVVAVEAAGAGAHAASTVGASAASAATGEGFAGELFITLDGIQRRYAVAVSADAVWVARDGHHLEVRTERQVRGGAGAAAGSLEAPMPGTVLLVHVADGDTVAEGDVLLVLESMKMELSITAPHAGTVAGLALAPGDRVALKQPLVAVVAQEASA